MNERITPHLTPTYRNVIQSSVVIGQIASEEMGTINLVELRADCVSQLSTAEQQVKELQAKITECRGKIAAIDTILRSNSDPGSESEVSEPEVEGS